MLTTKSILKSAVSLALLAVVLSPGAAFAAPLHVTPSVHALFDKSPKKIEFKLHNSSNAPIQLKIGDDLTTVAAGQTMDLKLASGTRIVNTTKSDSREAGYLICEVSSGLSKATINLK